MRRNTLQKNIITSTNIHADFIVGEVQNYLEVDKYLNECTSVTENVNFLKETMESIDNAIKIVTNLILYIEAIRTQDNNIIINNLITITNPFSNPKSSKYSKKITNLINQEVLKIDNKINNIKKNIECSDEKRECLIMKYEKIKTQLQSSSVLNYLTSATHLDNENITILIERLNDVKNKFIEEKGVILDAIEHFNDDSDFHKYIIPYANALCQTVERQEQTRNQNKFQRRKNTKDLDVKKQVLLICKPDLDTQKAIYKYFIEPKISNKPNRCNNIKTLSLHYLNINTDEPSVDIYYVLFPDKEEKFKKNIEKIKYKEDIEKFREQKQIQREKLKEICEEFNIVKNELSSLHTNMTFYVKEDKHSVRQAEAAVQAAWQANVQAQADLKTAQELQAAAQTVTQAEAAAQVAKAAKEAAQAAKEAAVRAAQAEQSLTPMFTLIFDEELTEFKSLIDKILIICDRYNKNNQDNSLLSIKIKHLILIKDLIQMLKKEPTKVRKGFLVNINEIIIQLNAIVEYLKNIPDLILVQYLSKRTLKLLSDLHLDLESNYLSDIIDCLKEPMMNYEDLILSASDLVPSIFPADDFDVNEYLKKEGDFLIQWQNQGELHQLFTIKVKRMKVIDGKEKLIIEDFLDFPLRDIAHYKSKKLLPIGDADKVYGIVPLFRHVHPNPTLVQENLNLISKRNSIIIDRKQTPFKQETIEIITPYEYETRAISQKDDDIITFNNRNSEKSIISYDILEEKKDNPYELSEVSSDFLDERDLDDDEIVSKIHAMEINEEISNQSNFPNEDLKHKRNSSSTDEEIITVPDFVRIKRQQEEQRARHKEQQREQQQQYAEELSMFKLKLTNNNSERIEQLLFDEKPDYTNVREPKRKHSLPFSMFKEKTKKEGYEKGEKKDKENKSHKKKDKEEKMKKDRHEKDEKKNKENKNDGRENNEEKNNKKPKKK